MALMSEFHGEVHTDNHAGDNRVVAVFVDYAAAQSFAAMLNRFASPYSDYRFYAVEINT